jgi:hypothetical protein
MRLVAPNRISKRHLAPVPAQAFTTERKGIHFLERTFGGTRTSPPQKYCWLEVNHSVITSVTFEWSNMPLTEAFIITDGLGKSRLRARVN